MELSTLNYQYFVLLRYLPTSVAAPKSPQCYRHNVSIY